MDNFVVSARKYRPSTFRSVVGQQHVTTTLQNAIQSHHLAQAFLFWSRMPLAELRPDGVVLSDQRFSQSPVRSEFSVTLKPPH